VVARSAATLKARRFKPRKRGPSAGDELPWAPAFRGGDETVRVSYKMQVEVRQCLGLNAAQELEPFLMAMALHALADRLAGCDV
jgi:hypothetical protein